MADKYENRFELVLTLELENPVLMQTAYARAGDALEAFIENLPNGIVISQLGFRTISEPIE